VINAHRIRIALNSHGIEKQGDEHRTKSRLKGLFNHLRSRPRSAEEKVIHMWLLASHLYMGRPRIPLIINGISGDGNYGVRIEEADAADATSIRYAMTG